MNGCTLAGRVLCRFAAPGIMLASVVVFACPVTAQSDASTEPALEASDAPQSKPAEAQRRWLLREGSVLVKARGTVDRDPATGWWQFTVRQEVDARVKQTLGLLPCSLLDEMVRVEESLPGREVVFELTGEIFVYRGHNFLLPTIAPQLIEYSSANDAKLQATEDAGDESVDATPVDTESSSDSVEDIIGDLESAVGGLARSAMPTVDEADAPGPGEFNTLVREQTMLLSRRGQVTRTTSGAWLFVFDADSQGLSDPPMILMPCLLLEHLEQRVWRSGASVPVLISGRTYIFDNRNYLLPTAFQIAREQTPMSR